EHEREEEPEEVARVRDLAVTVAAARQCPVHEQSDDAGPEREQRLTREHERSDRRGRDQERQDERQTLPVHSTSPLVLAHNRTLGEIIRRLRWSSRRTGRTVQSSFGATSFGAGQRVTRSQ